MDEALKAKFRQLAEEMETSAVRSLLKWGYKRKGKTVPSDEILTQQSRKAASMANDTLFSTGKTVWRDLKDVYGQKKANNEAGKKEKKGGAKG